MTKPYRIIIHYDDGRTLEKQLKEIGATYTKRHVMNDFWGVQFTIEKPKGKGATEKCRKIDLL